MAINEKSSENPQTETSGADDTHAVLQSFAGTPEHYLARLEGPAKSIYTAMGIQATEKGVLLPTENIQARMRTQGFECNLDFRRMTSVTGIVSPRDFLETIRDGYFPLANPWHDLVFHGPAVVSAPKEDIDLIQKAAVTALGSQDQTEIDNAVNVIDVTLGNPFLEADNPEELLASQERVFSELFRLTGLQQPGDSMVEAMRRRQAATQASAQAGDYAVRYLDAANAALGHAKALTTTAVA